MKGKLNHFTVGRCNHCATQPVQKDENVVNKIVCGLLSAEGGSFVQWRGVERSRPTKEGLTATVDAAAFVEKYVIGFKL